MKQKLVIAAGFSLLMLFAPTGAGSQTPNFEDQAPPINPNDGTITGKLFPSLAPVETRCGPLKAGQLEVELGSNGFVAGAFPFTVLSYRGVGRLVVGRDDQGALSVSGSFSSTPNGSMVTISDNVVTVDTSTTFKFVRSQSRLLVTDMIGQVVIDIWFANPTTVVINGKMYFGNSLLDATQIGLDYNGLHFSESCIETSGGNGSGIFIQ